MNRLLTSQHLRKRADECRSLADALRDGDLRDRMMSIADEYDGMAAERTEARTLIAAAHVAAGRYLTEQMASAVSLKLKHGRN